MNALILKLFLEDFLKKVSSRFVNWNTTLFGSGIGLAFASIVMYILNEAGCDFTQVELSGLVTFLGSFLVGGLATDNGTKKIA